MNPIINNLKDDEKYNEVLTYINNITKNNNKDNINITLSGVVDSQKAFLEYAIASQLKRSILIVCSNNMSATKMIQDLKFFSDMEIIYFPAKQLIYYDIESQSKEIENQRMYAIKKIFERGNKIVVTTIDALLTPLNKNIKESKKSINLKKDDKINLDNITQDLLKLGYQRTELVEGKGQFCIRGGLVDIFQVESDKPYRIELFGNIVDSIRSFSIDTQRSISTCNEISISCISENNMSEELKKEILSKLNELANSDINSELRDNILHDIDNINNNSLSNIYDKYFYIAIKESTTLLEILKDYIIFFDEPDKCIEKANNIIYENNETLKALEQRNYLYAKYANKYLNIDTILNDLKDKLNIYLQRQEISKSLNEKRKVIYFDSKEIYYYKNSPDILLHDIKDNKDKIILLVFPTLVRVEQIKNYLLDNSVKVEYLENIWKYSNLKKGKVYITYGLLSSGFNQEDGQIVFIVEPVSGTAFSSKLKKRKRKKENSIGEKLNSYDDLNIGDYVVHENHGIGIYRGLESVSIEDVIKDYIKIEYSNNSVLYVPINQLDMVKKYVCDDGYKPNINTLGTKEWQKTRKKVNEHIKSVAKELMLLYAKREKSIGFAFSKDTPWQDEFESSFPYELTLDQKLSIEQIKEDMESSKVMDRLLCGDVGYGKTEVALRVAFKAVMDKKQVAYLVPTTVLCLQQYRTFKGRMEKFGVRVEFLSRFKTLKEQKSILKDLVDGKIDIIIGTHRLLSKDLFFNDLGLLIIDEEHRFGVKAKESIKKLKETIDVLSMSATPIPRTLHMSMVGIRKISTLTEPPLERLPIHTYVLEYDENVIKDAIEKELLRDGQVIYINNRIELLDESLERIKNMVPSARIAIAHGRMEPRQVEDVMIDFMEHNIDIIICTTILETGIDIPNANTLIIEDADKLGLAQLYQIRGRVGRSSRLAYAYITYKKDKVISELSEKRLKAIKDFTEFGSGLKIALRDLEIRGAGNLLGKEQHGHMASVGYEMYLSLLEKAINDEKNNKKEESDVLNINKEIKIDLEVSAYISDSYIKDPIQKIIMYQKISNIQTKEESLDIVDELLDRYGDIPKETENLFKIVEIRNVARALNITRISCINGILKFEPSNHKIRLTNAKCNDILINVQLELEKLKATLENKMEG